MSTLTKSTIKHINSPTKQKIVILGAGFGGIKTALQLAKSDQFDIYLISDQDTFRYYPTLYETVTGRSDEVAIIPLAEIFEGLNINIIQDTALSLDRSAKKIVGKSGKKYDYDTLIIALGVVTNFFGIKGLEKYAYGVKTQTEAHHLRNHLHKQLVENHKPDLNYVIIGGGATGVELAGALPAYMRHIIKRHGLPTHTKLNIDLVEAESRLMPRMPVGYSRAVAKRLRKLGVTLYLGQTVQSETAEELVINGRPIKSHTVVWTAGVTNNPFLKNNSFNIGPHGKVVVDEYLQAEPHIYVIGDNAQTEYSGMAQTALGDGLFIADNLILKQSGKKPKTYTPDKPVYVTEVGNHWAAVMWNQVKLYGFIGWILRRLADFIGYHDLEPWWKASRHWLAEAENTEACSVCQRK